MHPSSSVTPGQQDSNHHNALLLKLENSQVHWSKELPQYIAAPNQLDFSGILRPDNHYKMLEMGIEPSKVKHRK